MTETGRPALLIYTDASHAKGSGSWGAVITGEGIETLEIGGAFKGPCPCSTTAEMQGVANALHIAIASGLLRRGTRATVLCDNQTVMHLISRKSAQPRMRLDRMKRRTPALWTALLNVRAALRDIRAEVSFEWVRGHQTAEAADHHRPFNSRADWLARHHNPEVERKRAAKRRKRQRARARRKAEGSANE